MIKNWMKFNESIDDKKYRLSDLTEDMFQDWLEDVRKEFGDDIKKSMNLIAVGITNIDDPKSTNKESWRNKLWDFFKNELSHQKRLLCDKCGNPMEVYYTVQCFYCDKPKLDDDGSLNYFLCTNWLEKNEEDFDQDELWDYLLDRDIIKGNDTYCMLPTSSNNDNMNIFLKHFDTKKTQYFVSW